MDGWRFPQDVRGWLTPVEGAKLADLARGKRVLEIGSYEGKSTICMAQVAASVDCIDPCDGRATTAPGEHLEPLTANLLRYGVNGNVRIFVGTTDDVAIDLDHASYDLVFIDGNHQRDMVENDIRHAKRLLAPGGRIAFHDYRSECDPGVTAAVDDLLFQGAVLEGVAGTVAVVCPKPAPEQKPLVVITLPRAGRWSTFGACRGFDFWPTLGRCRVAKNTCLSSGADRNFNRCFVVALEARKLGATHWAMLHEDVCPEQGWLDILMGEMARTGAGAVSGVVPIKDMRGLTSTAVESGDLWFPRRLSLKEVFELPETFGDEDVGGEVLLNTGLWLCDLGHPWVRDVLDGTAEPPAFQTLSKVLRKSNGAWASHNRSEDWEWSREMRRRGVKQVATRKVKLEHVGEHEFDNHSVWGEWETDEVYTGRFQDLAVPTPAEPVAG